MRRTIELVETPGSPGASRAWGADLADGTRVSVTHGATIQRNGAGRDSWWISPMWGVLIAYADGTTYECWRADMDAAITSPTRETARQEVLIVSATAHPSRIPVDLWELTVGRTLTLLGIPVDNDSALGMLGEDVLAGRALPTDLHQQAIRRVYPN